MHEIAFMRIVKVAISLSLATLVIGCAPEPLPGELGGACPCDEDVGALYCNDDDVCADVFDSETYLPNQTSDIGVTCATDDDGETSLTGAPYGEDTAAFVDAAFGSAFDIDLSSLIEPVAATASECRTERALTGMVINLPQALWQLRKNSVDEVRVVLQTIDADSGEELSSEPFEGDVEITGFDPDTLTLCGEIDVTFSDGANTNVQGTFAARGLCGLPDG
jgi:hypothetical protein